MRKSVVKYVSEYAATTPEKVAVIADSQETTYRELFELVRGYCNCLKKAGVKKGNIVVAKASQKLDFVVLYLAVHLAGGIIAPQERNTPSESILEVVKKLSARVIVDDLYPSQGADYIVLKRNNIIEAARENLSDCDTYSFPTENDSADILFTTGTTGQSKGVELSHKALTATAENLIFGCQYQKDTVMIVPGPLNHANAIRKVYTSLVNGSTVYILNGMMNMRNFFTALDYPHGRVACCLPPAAIRTIFQTTQDKIGEYSERIDFIESATAPLPEPDKNKLCSLLPNTRLYNNYGSSEAASVCMYDYNRYRGMAGCVGKAMPNSKIIVVDEEKREIESSKDCLGLLACIGDVNMKGYVNDPEDTADVLINGIVYTSDIGYIDKDGFVYVFGRKGDVINVGGLKVAPTEVESAALGYDGIEDCICIGIDDQIAGKALKLLVVLRDGAEFDRKGLRSFLLSRLERYKVPQYYEQVPRIEKTYNGKLNRKYYVTNDQSQTNEVIRCLMERRSIRDFTDKPVPRAYLETILQTGIHAPSGHNMQTWQFTVLQGSEKIEQLKSVTEKVAKEKNVHFYGFNNPQAVILVSNDRRNRNGIQDSSCAAENMMLAAHSLGLGSVWINALYTISDEPEIRALLDEYGVPARHIVWATLALGWPKEPGKLLAKKQNVIHWVD